jgi:hypothetical protein
MIRIARYNARSSCNSALSRDDVLGRIMRIVDTDDLPALIGPTRLGCWSSEYASPVRNRCPNT